MARTALALGRGALLAKVDMKSAYRLIPVPKEDRPLLGIQWKGKVYIDARLPFGLRSAPKIFSAVGDALEWCVRREGVNLVDHYLDDFIILGPPGSSQCSRHLQILQDVASSLGIPLAEEKTEGPSTCLTFRGIEVNTVDMTLSLPAKN